MPRIPDDELTRLKHDIPIDRLATARGVALKPSGNNLLSPFHDDHEPSLVITPEKNLWHCLGACQQGGSVIDWVMKAEGVSFRHAVELLRAEEVRSAESGTVRSSPPAPTTRIVKPRAFPSSPRYSPPVPKTKRACAKS
jgi:hypothetical protein